VAEYANLLFLTQYTEMYRQLLAIGAQLPLLRRLLRSLADF
jgi:sulfur transfer protein SufE